MKPQRGSSRTVLDLENKSMAKRTNDSFYSNLKPAQKNQNIKKIPEVIP